jgi:hypothetical protein
MRDGAVSSINLMSLLYPCITLAKIYDPIKFLNRGISRADIESALSNRGIAVFLIRLNRMRLVMMTAGIL